MFVVLFGLISRFLEYGDFSVAASDGFIEGVEDVLAEVVEVAVWDVDEAGVVVFVEFVAEVFNQRFVLFVEGSGYSCGFACDSVNHCFVFFFLLFLGMPKYHRYEEMRYCIAETISHSRIIDRGIVNKQTTGEDSEPMLSIVMVARAARPVKRNTRNMMSMV